MNQKERIEAIRRCYHQFDRLNHRYCGWVRPYSEQAFEAALKGEKDHYSFGSRFTGQRQKGRTTHEMRAQYFVCKWALSKPSKPNWAEACGVRDDARLAYGARDSLRLSSNPEARKAFRSWVRRWRKVIDSIDYSEHLSQGAL